MKNAIKNLATSTIKRALGFAIVLFMFSATASATDSLALQAPQDDSETVKLVKIQKSDPFSSETEIVVLIENECRATFTICTPLDAVVRQWVSQEMKPGQHIIKWDGRNNLGHEVASGVYLFKIHTQHCQRVETLALLH